MERQEDEVNPYQAPESLTAHRPPPSPEQLASRWARLGGAIIDTLVMMLFVLPVQYALGFFDGFPNVKEPEFHMQVLAMVIFIALFLVLHGYLVATRGQTIGKLLLGTRMVRTNGSAATFRRLVWLRYLPQWLVSMIPILGPFLVIVDPLFIFRTDKRCIHDLIADTKVVRAAPRLS